MNRCPKVRWLVPLILLFASSAEASGLVIYRFTATPGLERTAGRLTDRLLISLNGAGLEVIGESEVSVLLQHEEDRQSLSGCGQDPACSERLAKIVEADRLLTGHVARWGNELVTTVALAPAGPGPIERGSCAAPEERALSQCLSVEVLRLAGTATSAKAAPTPEGAMRIAVVDLEAHDPSLAPIAKDVTQLLSLSLEAQDQTEVIGRDDVEAMVDFTLDRAECVGDEALSCLVEIGGALGVRYLATGGLGKLGPTFVVHLKLIDIQNARVHRRVLEEFEGEASELRRAIRVASVRLLGRSLEGTGRLRVEGSPEGARIQIDGGAPRAPTELELSAGRHSVMVKAEDHQPLYRELYVEPNGLTRFRPTLTPLPGQTWYERWWVWTIVGVVVVAGATSATILATQGGPEDGMLIDNSP